MKYLIDIIFIAIFVFSVVITAKKGFINSVISVCAILLSIIIASIIAPPISEFVYENYVKDSVYNSTLTTVDNVIQNSETEATEKVNEVFNSLPKFISNISTFSGLKADNLTSIISDNIADSKKITDSLFSSAVSPAVTTLLNYLFVLIFFLAILFASKFLSKFFTGLLRGNLLGKANTLLGAVLGCISGGIFVILTYFLITLIANLFTLTKLTDAITESYICSLLADIL